MDLKKKKPETGPGRVSGQVWVFLIKPRPDLDPFRVFFFLNPYPTLFLNRPGKIRPIRVWPGRVSVGRAKIVIPRYHYQIPLSTFLFYITFSLAHAL